MRRIVILIFSKITINSYITATVSHHIICIALLLLIFEIPEVYISYLSKDVCKFVVGLC